MKSMYSYGRLISVLFFVVASGAWAQSYGSAQSGSGGFPTETPESIQNPAPSETGADEGSPADLAGSPGGIYDRQGEDQALTEGTGNASGDTGGLPQSQADVNGLTGQQAQSAQTDQSGQSETGQGGLGSGESQSGRAQQPQSTQTDQSGTQQSQSGQGGTGSQTQSGQPEQLGSGQAAQGGQTTGTGASGASAQRGVPPEQTGYIYRADELVRAEILGTGDARHGTVRDLVLTDSGRISWFIVTLEQFGGLQDGQYLVPVEDVRVEPGQSRPRVRIESPQPDRDLVLVQNDLQIRRQIDRDSVLYTNFMRYRVTGRNGEAVGVIEDLVLDMEATDVIYVAFSPAGTLGAAGNLIAMPWRDLTWNIDNRRVYIDTDAKELERARTFNQDEWPAEAALNWRPYFP